MNSCFRVRAFIRQPSVGSYEDARIARFVLGCILGMMLTWSKRGGRWTGKHIWVGTGEGRAGTGRTQGVDGKRHHGQTMPERTALLGGILGPEAGAGRKLGVSQASEIGFALAAHPDAAPAGNYDQAEHEYAAADGYPNDDVHGQARGGLARIRTHSVRLAEDQQLELEKQVN